MFINLIKEINSLLSKVKYLLKSYYWGEKLTSSKLRFSRFKIFFQFWGAPTHEDIIEF